MKEREPERERLGVLHRHARPLASVVCGFHSRQVGMPSPEWATRGGRGVVGRGRGGCQLPGCGGDVCVAGRSGLGIHHACTRSAASTMSNGHRGAPPPLLARSRDTSSSSFGSRPHTPSQALPRNVLGKPYISVDFSERAASRPLARGLGC